MQINSEVRKGNYEVILNYCREDTKWVFLGDQQLDGREAVREYLKSAYLAPPKFTAQLLADGDFVIATGEISLVDADNKWSKSSYCDIWKFESGQISTLKAFVIAD